MKLSERVRKIATKLGFRPSESHYFVLNGVQGLGPTVRATQFLQSFNEDRRRMGKRPYGLILPDLGEKQKMVVQKRKDIFDDKTIGHVYFDEKGGELIKEVFYSGDGGFEGFLEDFASTYEEKQAAINRHFKKPLEVTNAKTGRKTKVSNLERCVELARNHIVNFPFKTRVNYGFGERSNIIRRSVEQGAVDYDPETVEKALAYLEKVEAPKVRTPEDGDRVIEMNFVQQPDSVDAERKKVIPTPLHARTMDPHNNSIEPGIYVSVTGIPGLAQQVADAATSLDLKIYTASPEQFESLGVDVEEAQPSILTNRNLKYSVARAGWGGITEALQSQTPLLLVDTGSGDDPEIIQNARRLKDLGLASILDERSAEEVLLEAQDKADNAKRFLKDQREQFGTVEGPVYAGGVAALVLD